MISYPALRKLTVAAMAAAFCPMAMTSAVAGDPDTKPPRLICQVRYASETRLLHQSATPDPYTAATMDFDNRFRFRAVVLGSSARINHITLTVYELAEGDTPPVIVHQARYQPPFNMGSEIPALTGWNHVYANHLGRELRYGCALEEKS